MQFSCILYKCVNIFSLTTISNQLFTLRIFAKLISVKINRCLKSANLKNLRIATDANNISDYIKDTKVVITNNFELGLEGRLTNKIRYGTNYFINKQKVGTTYIVNPVTNFFELSRFPEIIYCAEFKLKGNGVNCKLSVCIKF